MIIMKTRVLIVIEGGIIQQIHSTDEVEYIIVDKDVLDSSELVSEVKQIESIFLPGYAYEYFEPDNIKDDVIRSLLTLSKF